ncbi:hypothetical protein CALCODRAFT_547203 [Calocera cornea HHB12733]|uniref:Uncharacterized protein n=1 Tax=Calocera cornea HHB12733 TaxID=1353952 RepID=A0A165EI84_9BASI|nr:hypothetical protein CALCODRAFT_547203 [Calocera cornea HHB12733]
MQSSIDPALFAVPSVDPGLLVTMNLVEEIRDLIQVYDAQSSEPDHLARGRRIKFLTQELSARPALMVPATSNEPSETPPVDPIDESRNEGDDHSRFTPLSIPSKRRPALKTGQEEGTNHPKRVAGALAKMVKAGFDETDFRMKKVLQREMRTTMQRLIGYAPGRTMPNAGGPLPDAEAGSGPFLIPDFKATLSDTVNLRIQQRAADAVIRTQMSAEGVVPPAYRTRWLDENVLIDLGQKSWPGLKAVWQKQVHDAQDNGAASALRRRQGKRRERRNIAADQIRKGIKVFCEDNQLDHTLVELELVNEEWMGEEWSGDEEGIQSPAWRQALFERGSISAQMRDSSTRIEALEMRRPAWMHIHLWEWFKAQRAGRPRTQKKPEKPRADLGNVSHRMPEVIPFDFMLDPHWAATQLPKWDESYWKRRQGWPASFGARAPHIASSMLAAPPF